MTDIKVPKALCPICHAPRDGDEGQWSHGSMTCIRVIKDERDTALEETERLVKQVTWWESTCAYWHKQTDEQRERGDSYAKLSEDMSKLYNTAMDRIEVIEATLSENSKVMELVKKEFNGK